MEIKIANLNKEINNKIILKNINIEFKAGKYYGFLGNNGTGKTTFLKCLFNEYIYQTGEIYLDNKKINTKDFNQMFYFPDNNDLPKNISVYSFLQTQYLFYKNTLKDFDKILSSKNVYFKSINLKKMIIGSLSSGQQKLVSLLSCKILEPKIIFFDEPTTNLDISNKQLIIDEIKKIDVKDKIIVIITHLVEEFQNIFDEIIILNDGKIAFQGRPANDLKKQFLEIVGYGGIKNA